jgi:hypothetical protein
MRLLKRHDDTDDEVVDDPSVRHEDRPMTDTDRPTAVPEADRVPPERPTVPDHGGPAVPDARAEPEPEPEPTRPERTYGTEPTTRNEIVEDRRYGRGVDDTSRVALVPERVTTDDVVVTHWSVGDVLVALIGAALAAVGIIVLVRTGVNETWYRPTTSIFGADHTPLLGLIEAGTGAVLALTAIARMRFVTTLIGLAMAVAGVVAAIETSEWSRELAIEDWWAWTMAGVGLVVALLALVPRRGHVDRVVRPA